MASPPNPIPKEKKNKQKLVTYDHASEREKVKKKEAANPSDSLALALSSSVKTQALRQPQPDTTLQSHDDFPKLSTTIQGGKQFPKSSSSTPRGKKQFRPLDLGNSPVQSPWSVHGGPSAEKKDKQKLVSYDHASERDNWIEVKKKEAANPSDSLALALSSSVKIQSLSQPQPDTTLQYRDDFPELSTTIQGGKQFPKSSSSTPRGKKQFRPLDLVHSPVQSPWSVHGGPSAENKNKQKLVTYDNAAESDNLIDLKKKEAANPSVSLSLAPSSSVKTQSSSQPP